MKCIAREDCCIDHKGLNLDPGNQQTGAVRTDEVVGLLEIGAAFSCYPECLTPGQRASGEDVAWAGAFNTDLDYSSRQESAWALSKASPPSQNAFMVVNQWIHTDTHMHRHTHTQVWEKNVYYLSFLNLAYFS